MTRTLAILLPALALAACTVTSPDGVEFPKGAREEEVRARLGDPDFKEEFEGIPGFLNPWGYPPGFILYYLDRGYGAWLFKGGLGRFQLVRPEDRSDLEGRARVYREVVPLVPREGTPAQVVTSFGTPDLVEREFRYHFIYAQLYNAPPWPPAESVTYCYLNHQLAVVFNNGRVKQAKPMSSLWQEQTRQSVERLRHRGELAAKDPPRAGMTGVDVRERWGIPPVVSGVVRSREVLTQPGEDPGKRLGAEITRWYYPTVDSVVHLSGGVVTSIEPLDPARKKVITDFYLRADRISARIGRTAEQPLD